MFELNHKEPYTMKSEHLTKLLTILAFAFCVPAARAADLQAKTIDGQVVQGEYLGTENNIVRIKTIYGTVSIPSKNIVTLLAVSLPDKPEGVPAVKDDVANLDALVFKEPKTVNLASLLAARMPRIPEAGVQSRIELFRLIRNFGDSSDASRLKIIRNLGSYGLMAYPYIEGSYVEPLDLNDKVQLVQAVSGQRKPYSAQIFSQIHASLLADMARATSIAPQLPTEIVTKRNNIVTREQHLRGVANNIRLIEGYASQSGGPFNALFLLTIYKDRYGANSDALLKDLLSDRARLAATAIDYKNPATGWTVGDRVALIEITFPLYFKDNDDLKDLAEDFLKKLLPEKHPKWDTPQAEWFEWWGKQRDELLKAK